MKKIMKKIWKLLGGSWKALGRGKQGKRTFNRRGNEWEPKNRRKKKFKSRGRRSVSSLKEPPIVRRVQIHPSAIKIRKSSRSVSPKIPPSSKLGSVKRPFHESRDDFGQRPRNRRAQPRPITSRQMEQEQQRTNGRRVSRGGIRGSRGGGSNGVRRIKKKPYLRKEGGKGRIIE